MPTIAEIIFSLSPIGTKPLRIPSFPPYPQSKRDSQSEDRMKKLLPLLILVPVVSQVFAAVLGF